MKSGIELIAEERQEQITKHHRTVENDVKLNSEYQLLFGAKHLLEPFDEYGEDDIEMTPTGWDEDIYRKMLNKTYKDRLVIAGALIAAEIDRLQAPVEPYSPEPPIPHNIKYGNNS